jgi:signal peptidase I
LFRAQRLRRAAGGAVREPVVVEYARSFFPIILIVLLIRSFLFEPFPHSVGFDDADAARRRLHLRQQVHVWPAAARLNTEFVDFGAPQRGDVVVFRLPADPSTNYIKRLVGLPGDHIVVRDKRVYVNGSPQPVMLDGIYSGFGHDGAQIGLETLGVAQHRVLYIPIAHRSISTASCPPVISSSWATIATTAATAGSRRSVSSLPATSSARPCASGSTGIYPTHRCGSASVPQSTEQRGVLQHEKPSAWHDPSRIVTILLILSLALYAALRPGARILEYMEGLARARAGARRALRDRHQRRR